MQIAGLAGGRISYNGGTSGAVTVPAGKLVIGMTCLSTAGGSFTIAPGGANHPAPPAAGDSVPLPAGVAFDLPRSMCEGQLGGGTVFTFTGTASYFIGYESVGVGAGA